MFNLDFLFTHFILQIKKKIIISHSFVSLYYFNAFMGKDILYMLMRLFPLLHVFLRVSLCIYVLVYIFGCMCVCVFFFTFIKAKNEKKLKTSKKAEWKPIEYDIKSQTQKPLDIHYWIITVFVKYLRLDFHFLSDFRK